MKKYEIMFIIRPDMEQEKYEDFLNYYKEILVKEGAKILSEDVWGLRDLAYPIKKFVKGYYIILNLESTTEAIEEFDRLARINESTLRYIVIDENKKNKLNNKKKKQPTNKSNAVEQRITREENAKVEESKDTNSKC